MLCIRVIILFFYQLLSFTFAEQSLSVVLTVLERPRPLGPDPSSISFSSSSLEKEEAVDMAFESLEFRYKQTAAQSSTLEVGYLCLQALTAVSTKAFAAEERDGAEATIFTTSSFESTSQIYHTNIRN
ncbi:hypothetical protein Bca52824_094424 [Brassica carinata]|uniref:Uncharacterized protein n=1 Tax=Brassica carinata TaxID=52824 RepID=A0A8X7P4G8_BRACI|nr:hypothetical protein Bca52824_094424 [Brassica carinata]